MKEKAKPVRKIFVVDDDKLQVAFISKILKKEGYVDDHAYTGEEALEKIFSTRYDLILIDILLPDIDGFEICRRIKLQQATRNIPVILISGYDDKDIYQKGFELGVMDYLKKPLTPAELVFKIKNYLKLARTEEKLRQNEILFRSVVNDQAEFVVRYKPDGTLVFVNTAFSRYLGKPVSELIGSNFFDQLRIDLKDKIRSQMLENDVMFRTYILKTQLADGRSAWHHWTQRSIEDQINHKLVIQSIGRDITESKKNEDVLKQFEYIFRHAGWGIVANKPDSIVFEQVNEAYARMHGYTVEELKGRKISSVFVDESDSLVRALFSKALKYGHYSYHSIHKRKDGQEFPAYSDLTVMNSDTGEASLLIANVQDISESVEATKALAESEEKFRSVFRNSPDIILILRVNDLQLIDVNDNFIIQTGYTKEDVLRRPNFIMRFFDDPSEVGTILELLKVNDVVSNIEAKIKSKSTELMTVLMSCSKIFLNGASHVIAIIRNIENIKKFQESLQKSETKFRMLADYNYNWEFWLGPDGKYIYVSPSCERISGFNAHDFEKVPDLMIKLIHPDFVDMCHDHFKNEYSDTGPKTSLEFLIVDINGESRWIEHNCNPVFDESGKFLGRRGNNLDITQKKIADNELLKLNTAIEQSSPGIVITDVMGVIEYVNPYFEKMTGYKSEEVLGKNSNILKSGKTDPRVYDELWDTITSGKIWQGEFINRKKTRELYFERDLITPVKDKDKRIVNFIAIKEDITKQKKIDRKILQTVISTEEKERSRFAQDLHDDLGPLLSTAKLYIRSFETARNLKNRQIAIDKSMETIDEAILSIKEIANNLSPHILRNFGLVTGINSIVNKINETGTIKIKVNTEIEERFDENIESSLFRVFSELINNAVKHSSATLVVINMNKSENELLINYSDNGVGFELKKALNKQSSRGLSNIINRIKSLGGEIIFDTAGSKGVRIFITIPISDFLKA